MSTHLMNPDQPLRELARSILHTVTANALLVDRDLGIVAVSPTMESILGSTASGALETNLNLSLSDPHDRLLITLIRQALRGETHLPALSITINRHRMRMTVRSILKQPPLAMLTFVDVAEEENLARESQRAQERYYRALNTGKVVIWEWDALEDRVYLEPDIRPLLALDPTAPLTDPRTWQILFNPHDFLQIREIFVECTQGKRDQIELKARLRTGKGEERWFLLRGSVSGKVNGHPAFFSGTALDITESEIALEALRQSEERFALAFRMSPAPLVIASLKEGVARDVNTAFLNLVGYSREEVIGRTANAIGINADPTFRERFLAQLEANGYAKDVENRSRTRSGEIRHTLISGALINYGGEQCYMTLTYDITERKRYEAEILHLAVERERVLLLERFIADASHDLRTPLTVLSTSAYILEKYSKSALRMVGMINSGEGSISEVNQEMSRMLSILLERSVAVKSHTARLADMVERMLDLARLDRQTLFSFSRINLNNLIEDLLLLFEVRAQRTSITLITNLQPLPLITADRVELSRAIQNILENALNYTPMGGTVRISTRSTDDSVILAVQDTGIGIAPHDLPHIFSRFFRADPARGTHQGGSGLGLAIARKIVETHQGRIEVQSELNKGTTFTLILRLNPQVNDQTPGDGQPEQSEG